MNINSILGQVLFFLFFGTENVKMGLGLIKKDMFFMQTSSSHQKQTHVSLWSRSEGTKDGQKTSPNIVVQLLCSRLVEPGGRESWGIGISG